MKLGIYFKEYSINIFLRTFASEIIAKLKDEGNKIYIITVRGSFYHILVML